MTTTIKTALSEHIEALNEARTKETAKQIETRLAKIDELVEKLNATIIVNRIDEILAKVNDKSAMFKDWLDDRTVDVYSVKKSQKTGEYSLKVKEKGQKTSRHIAFNLLEAAYQCENGEKHEDGTVDPDFSLTLANSKKYHRMLTYFVDNLAACIAGELSDGAGKAGKVEKPKMTTGTETECAELDFNGHSINSLENQLNHIVKEILPFEITMKRADVRAIKQAVTKEKHLQFDMKKEAYVLDNIIDAIQTRMADTAYTLNSKAVCHKEPKPKKSERTEKQEEVMSKVGERAEAEATLSKRDEQTAAA